MAYCSAADVKVYTGTVVSDSDLGAMITDADSEISQFFLTRGGLSPGTAAAKQASILLVRGKVAERYALTGENPTSYTSGDWSQSGVSDHSASGKEFRAQAYQILKDELNRLTSPIDTLSEVKRADAVMDDFKLDQSDLPDYFSEEI